jgi:hypothetical protein
VGLTVRNRVCVEGNRQEAVMALLKAFHWLKNCCLLINSALNHLNGEAE